MSTRDIYHHGSYPDLDVAWGDPLVDLTAYDSFSLVVAQFGSAVLFTKVTGFTAQALVDSEVPNPNLTVQWSQVADEELDSLPAGTYILEYTATDSNNVLPDSTFFSELVILFDAANHGYCAAPDLLLGDLVLDDSVNVYDYINGAADEMDSEIGQRYTLPLVMADAAAWVVVKLKDINAKLATGRLILAIAAAGGLDKSLHAYGADLVKMAWADLRAISDGTMGLTGLTIDPASVRATAPAIRGDSASAVDAMAVFTSRTSPYAPPRTPFSLPIWVPDSDEA